MRQTTNFKIHRGWKHLLLGSGFNPVEVLTMAELPTDLLNRSEVVLLSPEEYFSFCRAIQELTAPDSLPIKFRQAVSPEYFNGPLFASLCSKNLNEALQRFALFKPLISPISLAVNISDEQTIATLEFSSDDEELPLCAGILEFIFLISLARLGTKKEIVPLSLELPFEANLPAVVASYEEYFGRKISFGNKIEIVFSAKDALYPFFTENQEMWNCFKPGLQEHLSELEGNSPVSKRIRCLLLTMLPSGTSSLEEAAAKLGIGPRTLQRKLARESIKYKSLVNDTRRELAEYYLRNMTISIPEITYLLGYQDSNSFQRAFKEWTGITPGEYRSSAK